MDQEPINTTPPVETPPVAPPQAPVPAQPPVGPEPAMVTPPPTVTPPPQPPKSKTGLIIAIVAGVVVLLGVIAAVAIAMLLKGANKTPANSPTSNTSQTSSDSLDSNNATTAKYSSDYEAVCHGGSITNAATFTKAVKPYKAYAFSHTSADYGDTWSSVTLSSKDPSTASLDNITEANVVACLAEKSGTATKSQTCQFESGGTNVTLDYYSLKYTLEFREAKTGKLVGTGTDVNGPATKCPTFVSYDKSNPKIYADPDENAVQAAVVSFAQ